MGNKEVKKAGHQLPANISPDFGVADELDSTDLQQSYLTLLQSNSEKVQSGEYSAGDIVDSVTGEVLASKKKPLEVIIFHASKYVKVYEVEGDERTYVESKKFEPNIPLEFEENGRSFKNEIVSEFQVLLAGDDIEEQLPCILQMAGTQNRTARIIKTKCAQLKRQGLSSASVVFEISSELQKNKKGAWLSYSAKMGRKTTEKEFQAALNWYQLSQKQAKPAAPTEKSTVESSDSGAPFRF